MERVLYLALQVFPLSSLATNINLLSIEWSKRLQSFFLETICTLVQNALWRDHEIYLSSMFY